MKTHIFSRICLICSIFLLVNVSSYATKFSVDVRDFEFSPSDLPTVRIGDTIHWEWKDGFHTTTSSTIPAGAAAWDQTISSGNMTFDYIPTVLGVYNYVCTPHISAGMVGSFTVTAAAGIPGGTSPVSISVYPNPAVDLVNLKAKPDANSRIEKLSIIDPTGRVLREFSWTGNERNLEMQLSLEGLPSGLLILEFRESTGVVSSRRLIRK